MYQIKEEIEDKSLAYPDYYTVPFHGKRAAGPGAGAVSGGATCMPLPRRAGRLVGLPSLSPSFPPPA